MKTAKSERKDSPLNNNLVFVLFAVSSMLLRYQVIFNNVNEIFKKSNLELFNLLYIFSRKSVLFRKQFT